MPYRVLIMTASLGSGHKQAAAAVAAELRAVCPDGEIVISDIMDIFKNQTSDLIRGAYLKMIDYLPNGYRLLYYLTSRMKPGGLVTDALTWKLRKRMLHYLRGLGPDYIMFTDPFSAALVLPLKSKGKISVLTGMVITDYTAHPIWLNSGVDRYYVASAALMEDLILREIPRERIEVTGIPVGPGFQISSNPENIRTDLDLRGDLPTVLVMGGGLGLGPIDRVVETLAGLGKPLQVVAVAGKNHELFQRLASLVLPGHLRFRVLGYCNDIPALMAVSDLLISKAGGLTLSEAMCKGLPVVVYDPLPGQELANAHLLCAAGTARMVSSLNELALTVDELLFAQPQLRVAMAKNCRILGRPFAARAVAEMIVNSQSVSAPARTLP